MPLLDGNSLPYIKLGFEPVADIKSNFITGNAHL